MNSELDWGDIIELDNELWKVGIIQKNTVKGTRYILFKLNPKDNYRNVIIKHDPLRFVRKFMYDSNNKRAPKSRRLPKGVRPCNRIVKVDEDGKWIVEKIGKGKYKRGKGNG